MIRWVVGTMGLALLATTAVAQGAYVWTPKKKLLDVPIAVPAPAGDAAFAPMSIRLQRQLTPAQESAIKSRVKMCVEQGSSTDTCKCRAETTAQILKDADFQEETWHLESDNQAGLRDFQNRMLAEQPDRMFELGEALGQCPATFMKLE